MTTQANKTESGWTSMASGEPEFGDLVLIRFFAKRSHILVCRFDNIESWESRTDQLVEFDLGKDYVGGWFTEDADADMWWERKYVSHWMPIPTPPSPSSEK